MAQPRKPPPVPYTAYTGVQKKSLGARSELLTCADLLARGADVYRSVLPTGIDLIALIGDTLEPIKIEVRSGKRRQDKSISYASIPAHLKRHDVLAVVIPTGEVYYFGPQAGKIHNLISSKRLTIHPNGIALTGN